MKLYNLRKVCDSGELQNLNCFQDFIIQGYLATLQVCTSLFQQVGCYQSDGGSLLICHYSLTRCHCVVHQLLAATSNNTEAQLESVHIYIQIILVN